MKDNISELLPNSSCMGIRLSKNNHITFGPYPSSKTFKNIKENGIISINFSDNIYYYTLAALKGKLLPEKFRIFPQKYYEFHKLDLNKYAESIKETFKTDHLEFPYIKDAWGVLFCEKINEKQKMKRGSFEEKSKITKFELKVVGFKKFQESFKLFNRAENLMLETIILATRLKLAVEKSHNDFIRKINQEINKNIDTIKRFGKNQEVLDSLELVECYRNQLNG